jgi:urease accessory protein
MYALTCRSEPMTLVPSHARARGEIRVEFHAIGSRTEAARIYEAGGLRLKFPNVPRGCEAVIVNTGGGIAGGDQSSIDITAEEGADVTLTTQSAEKIYRAQSDQAEIALSIRAEAGARLEWLPQETIIFDGARLSRRLDIDLDAQASLLLVESVIFGRMASGELRLEGSFRDRWRVRRDKSLIFAEDVRLDGDVTGMLDRPAIGRGARATATMLHVGPDAEGMIEPIRAALANAPCEWGASAWNGMAVARLLSPSPEQLRAAILILMQALRGRDAPRVWQ